MNEISVSWDDSLTIFSTYHPHDFKDLQSIISDFKWSPATYKDSYRKKDNFIQSEIIALDFDEGMTLDEAKEKFKTHKHIIGTTKSHQKEKNGKTCDRFRVVLFLDKSVEDCRDYEHNFHLLVYSHGADKGVKDGARFFYPCEEIVSVNENGTMIVPQEAPIKVEACTVMEYDETRTKGSLSRATLHFLAKGAEPGTWNSTLFKVAVDFKEQGYTEEECTERCTQVTGVLDGRDIPTIKSGFNRVPKYEPRKEWHEDPEYSWNKPVEAEGDSEPRESRFKDSLVVTPSQLATDMFAYLEDKDLVKGTPTHIKELDELLGGGLREGELNVWHAQAKTGKNSLWHQIIYNMVGQKTRIGYCSREISPESEVLPNILSIHFGINMWKVDISDNLKKESKTYLENMELYFAKGYGYMDSQHLEFWIQELKTLGVKHFFFDHLHYMISDPEEHKEASLLIKRLKTLAMEMEVNINIIVQPNKLQQDERLGLNSIKGGAAIGQALDNLITMRRLTKEQAGDVSNVMEVCLKEARHKLCRTGCFRLQYDPQTTRFIEEEKEDPCLMKEERVYDVQADMKNKTLVLTEVDTPVAAEGDVLKKIKPLVIDPLWVKPEILY